MRTKDENKNTDVNGYNRKPDGKFGAGNMGRPPGIKDKTTNAMKQFLVDFLQEKSMDLYDAWDELTPKERVVLFVQIAKLVMPNQQEDEQREIIITLKEAEK